MPYCTQCGNGLPDDDNGYKYCERCGRLNYAPTPRSLPELVPMPAAAPRAPFWDRWYGLPISSTPHYGKWTAVAILISLNIVGYVWLWMYSIAHLGTNAPTAEFFLEQLRNGGAQFGPAIAAGQYWRLLTSAFLHHSFSHLFGNLLLLWMAGRPLEFFCGRMNTLSIYLLSAAGGSLLSLTAHPQVTAIGASSAVFGMLGALTVLCFSRNLSAPRWKIAGLLIWTLLLTILEMPVAFLLSPLHVDRHRIVDDSGHLGGLLTGLALGALLLWSFRLPVERRQIRQRRIIASAALPIVALLMVLVYSHHLDPKTVATPSPEANDATLEKQRRLVLQNPNDADAHMVLAKLLMDQRTMNEAEPEFRRALELRPGWHTAECGLAATMAAGRPQESLDLYRKCLPYLEITFDAARVESSSFFLTINFGIAVYQVGKDTAERSARAEVAAHPDQWEAHFWLAHILNENYKHDEALREQKVAEQLKHRPLNFYLQ